MERMRIVILCSLALHACIDLPARPSGVAARADASVSDAVHLDAGPLRPADAPPYNGPECDTASGHVAWLDSGQAFGGGDGGASLGLGGNFAGPSSGPGDPAQLPVKARRPNLVGELVITEIMSNPASLSDTDGEWFELHNPSTSQNLDLGGCMLNDGSASEKLIPAPMLIAPGAYAVVVRSAAAGLAANLVISFLLGNEADTIAVRCDGIEIDRVAYGPGFPLLSGVSMSLDPQVSDALSNDQAPAWCPATISYGADLGTPGTPNPDCDEAAVEDAGAD